MADAKPTATYVNLDAQCARYAALIEGEIRPKDASKLEILARNGLGVLREQGIYALFMYLRYRDKGDKLGVWRHIAELLRAKEINLLRAGGEEGACVRALTRNLDDLLLARELVDQTLIYALYGLRARNDKQANDDG